MDRSRSKGDYIRTLERRISDLKRQNEILVNRDQSSPTYFVGGTGAPAFASGWSNYGSVWSPAGFYKDAAGIVHVIGLVVGGTSTIFILPEGFRPATNQDLIFPADGNGAFARLDINSAGAINLAIGSATSYLTLSTISFRPA